MKSHSANTVVETSKRRKPVDLLQWVQVLESTRRRRRKRKKKRRRETRIHPGEGKRKSFNSNSPLIKSCLITFTNGVFIAKP